MNFAVGSFKISAADEEELRKLAQTTTGITRYMIEVTGYADSTGSASVNTKIEESLDLQHRTIHLLGGPRIVELRSKVLVNNGIAGS